MKIIMSRSLSVARMSESDQFVFSVSGEYLEYAMSPNHLVIPFRLLSGEMNMDL